MRSDNAAAPHTRRGVEAVHVGVRRPLRQDVLVEEVVVREGGGGRAIVPRHLAPELGRRLDPEARKVLGWPKRCKLAHPFL